MAFNSEIEAYKFYNDYAKRIGFIVRKDKYVRLADGTIRKRYLVCSRHGFSTTQITTTYFQKKFILF